MNRTATTARTPAVRVPAGPSAAHATHRPRAWLAALLLTALAPSASALEVMFGMVPMDSTVVAGHLIGFSVQPSNLDISNEGASYNWYRNGVMIPGQHQETYVFTAQSADNGARYQVLVSGHTKDGQLAGPTASPSATLTVLPAGTALPPQLTVPQGDTVWYVGPRGNALFRALGNDLSWQYRYDTDTQWSYSTHSSEQSFLMYINPPTGATKLSLRVTDDAGAVAERTWKLALNQAPLIVTAPTAAPNPVTYPNPVTLSVSASDPDGDTLSYTWRAVGAAVASPPWVVFPTFVPNGTAASAVCTATAFPMTNATYTILVNISDTKGASVEAVVPITVRLPDGLDPRADVNGDGVINALDLGIVTDSFGQP